MLFAAVIVCLMGIMYQANTSTSFYPGALDGVTAVVMIDIIVAIIYYLTVLFSEMAILYNEDNKRKQLERAARERGGKQGDAASLKGDKAQRDSAGGRLVDELSGEINTGRIETNTNPLFLSASGGASGGGGGGGGGSGGGAALATIMAQRNSPPQELWQGPCNPRVRLRMCARATAFASACARHTNSCSHLPPLSHAAVFQAEFAAVAQQLAAAKEQVLEGRKQLAVSQSGGGGGGGDGGGGGGGGGGGKHAAAGAENEDTRTQLRKAKAEFAPRTVESTMGSAAAKLLVKKSSKKALAAM